MLILLSTRAKLRGLSIDAMSDNEIIDFAQREWGEHIAELLRRIISNHN